MIEDCTSPVSGSITPSGGMKTILSSCGVPVKSSHIPNKSSENQYEWDPVSGCRKPPAERATGRCNSCTIPLNTSSGTPCADKIVLYWPESLEGCIIGVGLAMHIIYWAASYMLIPCTGPLAGFQCGLHLIFTINSVSMILNGLLEIEVSASLGLTCTTPLALLKWIWTVEGVAWSLW